MQNVEFNLPFEIHIVVTDGHTHLSSALHDQLVDPSPTRADPGLAVTHAMESLLLALAARGLDLGTPQASLAIQDAVESVAEYLSCI